MMIRNPIRVRLETWLTRLAFHIIPVLPRKAVVRLANLLGSTSYIFSRKLKKIGMVNLDVAFGAESDIRLKRQILKQSYTSMALVLLDTFWFSRDTSARVSKYVVFDRNFETLFKDQPQVVISAHYGNWEMLGMGITQKGYPLHSVAKPLKNPRVDALFDEVRNKTGQKIVKRRGAVRTLLRILQQGGKIGLVMDQNTKLSEGGQFFDFFGLPASFSTAGAALAIKTQSNVVVCTLKPFSDGIYRGDYCHEITIEPYLAMESDQAITQLTEHIVHEMEQIIRAQPEYWLWTYKRWKYIPEGDSANRYPFYRRNAV